MTTEALVELNDRWRNTGRAHAVPEGEPLAERWLWFCPDCGERGVVAAPLFVAMNDALTHSKVHCPAIS